MTPITHHDLAAPTTKAKAFNDAAWVWELKHDGYRALLIKHGERASMLTRRGNDLIVRATFTAHTSSISAATVLCILPRSDSAHVSC
jgi:ATP-dependent DNA ligase